MFWMEQTRDKHSTVYGKGLREFLVIEKIALVCVYVDPKKWSPYQKSIGGLITVSWKRCLDKEKDEIVSTLYRVYEKDSKDIPVLYQKSL